MSDAKHYRHDRLVDTTIFLRYKVKILSIRIATKEDANEWNKIVERDPLSKFYDRFEWCTGLRLISENIKPLPLIVEKNGAVNGVFPLCLRKESFVGYLESIPFSDYGGGSFFRSKSNVFSSELLNNLVEIGTQNRCCRVTIRRAFFDDLIQANLLNKPVVVEAKNCTFIIPLEDEIDNIFQRFKKTRRKNIRQAEARGAIVREAENLDDLESYYRIYLCNMQRLGGSPLPFQFFKYLWDVFKPKGEMKIFLAEYDHKVIAGVLRFVYKQVIYARGAVSLSEYWNLRPMDLLEWHSIEWGVEHNLKLFDFCATPNDPSSGLHRFKESWGGEKKVLYNYHILLQPNRLKFYKYGIKLVGKIKNVFR